jgi:hypothetical protein
LGFPVRYLFLEHEAMKKMWEFKTKNFTVQWHIEPDSDCDTSFDETGETQEKIDSGEWECFSSRIRVIHNGTRTTLGEDWLGGSIYEDPEKFRDHIGAQGKHGSYFRQMVRSAISEAREAWPELQESLKVTLKGVHA